MAPTMTSHSLFSRLQLPRRTARLRFTLFYGGLFLVSGVVLLTITNVGGARLAGGRPRPPPLRSITASAQRISASNLHERLALAGPDDEFKELGDTLDGLLSRLEASFEAQRRFVANASHELRTPLTLERTLLQLALADPGATRASLRSTCEELLLYGEAQERLIEALLTLATSEQGLETSHPVDLSAITELVVGSARQEARGLAVSLEHDIQPASTTGDPRLVERLVANLVHNALGHNTPGGSARVKTGTRDGLAYLSVSNTGPVVDAGDIERLFQPFQRLDGPRLSQSRGHGLGLAIVKAIATAHNATVVTKARPGGGLAIEVRFVAARPAPVHVADAADASRELEPVDR